MNQSKASVFLFIFTFLFAGFNTINAQALVNTSIEEIANLEGKSFAYKYGNARVSGDNGYSGTVASTNFDVNFYRCEWEIDPNIRFIKGKVTSYFTITAATDKIVYDLSDTLNVDSHYLPWQSIIISKDCK